MDRNQHRPSPIKLLRKGRHNHLRPRSLPWSWNTTKHLPHIYIGLDTQHSNMEHRWRHRSNSQLRRRTRRIQIPTIPNEGPHRHLGRRRPNQLPGYNRMGWRRNRLLQGPIQHVHQIRHSKELLPRQVLHLRRQIRLIPIHQNRRRLTNGLQWRRKCPDHNRY